MALQPGLQLLEDARDGEEPGRLHRGQVGDDLARVRAGRHGHAEHDRQVVVGHPLGDVRRGQPGDHARAVGEVDDPVGRVDARQQVAVHELHALRRTGRPGRVDQRDEVLRLDRAPVRLGVEVRVGALDVGPRDGVVASRPLDTITCSSAAAPRGRRGSARGTAPRRSPRAPRRRPPRRRSAPA